MPAPVIYTGEGARPLFAELDAEQRGGGIDLFFVTDRAPRTDPEDPLPYSSERSHEMAWGSVRVEIDPALDAAELAAQSVREKRSTELELVLGETVEKGRFPRLPYAAEPVEGGIRRAPAAMDAHEAAASGLQADVARRIAASPRKDVVLYVHGYANDFQDAAFTMGELCHFLGREFVCGIFSWPAAGTRGLMAGYNVDRESGEFAVHHLRQAIRLIAAVPSVERLHVLAHSRGTDVVSSALRELSYEAYQAGSSLPERFKLKNVVLAAPDIDVDVAAAKVFGVLSDPDLPHGAVPDARGVFPAPGIHITVYSSRTDKALGLSTWLFGSVLRLGRADVKEMSEEERQRAARVAFLADIIEVEGDTGFIGHGYFVHDPDASADLIALLRYGIPAGAPGRPLESLGRPFWRVNPR